ncbi:MAG: DUF5343 domain-containing protein [Deltaproteobacteria bacterium]|nr:DUF5343 domain-containing protein [Deltaproteobacteria bacterium]
MDNTTLPYVTSPSLMPKIFEKIKDARVPEKFTQDFLREKLNFKGGNYMAFIPLAKKLNFLDNAGTPTEQYHQFRNPDTSGLAMANALRHGYKDVFERNEKAYSLYPEKFKGLIVEITGRSKKDRVVQLVSQTFQILKKGADFERKGKIVNTNSTPEGETTEEAAETSHEFKMGLSYNFNFVLPNTSDVKVFDAIFKSLLKHLPGK